MDTASQVDEFYQILNENWFIIIYISKILFITLDF